jgi:hypothetical protein
MGGGMSSEQIVGSGFLAAILLLYFMIRRLSQRVESILDFMEVQARIEGVRALKWGSSWPVSPEIKEKP